MLRRFRKYVPTWGIISVLGACAAWSQDPAARRYDPASDPLVNPPSLFQSAPADRSTIATDEVLYCNLNGSPNSLNPLFASTTSDERIRELVFDVLFKFDRKLDWYFDPAIVAEYRESADHLTTTVVLKSGLTWHDGAPFTAHDVEFSWRQILDPAVPCPSAKTGTDQIAECKALDDRTVCFTHQAALPINHLNVMFAIIPQHIYERGKADDPTLKTSDYHNQVNRRPVGNGPYKFVEWKEGDRIVLERWDGYHGAKPYFRQIVFRIITDAQAALVAFERQELDEVRLTPVQFARQTQTDSFRRVGVKGYATQWSYNYIAWNGDGSNPFFNDANVRRAMNYAFDYDRVLDVAYDGLCKKFAGLYPPESPWHSDREKVYTHDPARAAKLLDDAGWRIDPQTGWRHQEVPSPEGTTQRRKFEFTLSIPQPSATGPTMAAIFQEDLKKLGVDMKTRVLEWATFMDLCRNHQFEAQLSSWGTGLDPDNLWNLFHSSSYRDGRNYTGYSNARVDELFRLARHEMNPAARREYYAELFGIVSDEAPYTYVCAIPSLWAFNKRLSGVQFSPRGPYNFQPGVLGWWVPKGRSLHDDAGP